MLPHNADVIIIPKPDISYLSMKTLIEVHREGKYFIAIDLLTNVADQGLTEQEALQNLKKGLEEHYQLLIELTPRDHKYKSVLDSHRVFNTIIIQKNR